MEGVAQPSESSLAGHVDTADDPEALGRDLEFRRRLAALQDAARKLPPGSDEETQDELGLILQFLPTVERTGDAALLGNLELAVESLLAEPPNRLLALRLRESAQQAVLRRGFFRSILPGTSASTWVIAGMLFFLVFGSLVTLFFAYVLPFSLTLDSVHNRAPGGSTVSLQYVYVLLIPLTGALGSVVSILVRIRDFTEIRVLNPPALFWTGFFKPIIGATFALFVFAAVASGLISVNEGIDPGFMFLTLAFVAGFSERFAPDLVSRIEGSVLSSSGPQPPDEKRRAR